MDLFKLQRWRSKNVYIVEEHHQVLLPWSLERLKLKTAPIVLTLDHHTDVLPAFNERIPVEHQQFSRTPDIVRRAIDDLRHDEHLDFAIRSDIISRAVLFSHVNYAENVNPAIKIINFENLPEYPSTPELRVKLQEYYGRVLENDYLQKCLKSAEFLPFEQLFILDIDLDYFISERSIQPENSTIFKMLFEQCHCVTISMERDWVRLLNQDWEKSDADYFLLELKKMFG
ncbi:MAG: UPF0489 family protein [Victivallaceae bacterium]|nr:UPF0489 family protein [Victivallaceae bacterium]